MPIENFKVDTSLTDIVNGYDKHADEYNRSKNELNFYDTSDGYKTLTLSKNPELTYQNLYNNYDTIQKSVELVFRYGLDIAYHNFIKFTKLAHSNNETLKKLLHREPEYPSSLTNVNDSVVSPVDLYYDYLDKLNFAEKSNTIYDQADFFDKDYYTEKYKELETKLQYDFNNSGTKWDFITFDLENLSNIAQVEFEIGNSIKFAVSPMLQRAISNTVDESSLNPNQIICKYLISYDFNSFVNFLMNRAKFPKNPEDIVDLTQFIENNLSEYQTTIIDISKRIIIELLDRITDVVGNFDKFNTKSAILCNDIIKTDINQGIINKIRYLMRSNLGSEIDISRDSKYNKLFGKMDNRELIASVLDNIQTNEDHSCMGPLNDAFYYIRNSRDSYRSISNRLSVICSNIYKFAFAKFFSNTVQIVYDTYSKDNILLKKSYTYYREFDKKYDFIELFTNISKISDYNLRDFYQETIKYIKRTSDFASVPSIKTASGDKLSFLNCKASHMISIYALGIMLYIKKVAEYIDIITSSKSFVGEDNKLNHKLLTTVSDHVNKLLNIFEYIIQLVGYKSIYVNNFYINNILTSTGLGKLAFMSQIISKCYTNYFKNTSKVNDNIIKVFKMINEKEDIEEVDYDCTRFSDLTLKNIHESIHELFENLMIIPL